MPCRAGNPLRGLALIASLGLASPATAEITAASFNAPTTRYGHGVLGDAVEWGGLRFDLADGTALQLTLPETRVFEDLAPRLADVDGDGTPEVIVVETSLSLGARLSIYDETGLVAATPYIGQRHRWLAPIGAADLDGDGTMEIAYIDRPHLAKTLRVWRFKNGALTEMATHPGLTNHSIGWDHIPGGIRSCGDGPEMITANGDWTSVMATRLAPNGQLSIMSLASYTGPDSLNAALNCP
jgi:hypothetical protein